MSHVISKDIHGNEYHVSLNELKWRPACYGIVINDGKLLLTKQHGQYHLPGGGVDLGEMPESAVIREIKEETGIDVIDPKLVKHISGYFTFLKDEQKHHRQSILLYFICDYVGGELSLDGLMEDEKPVAEMAEWIPLNQIDDIRAGSTIDWRAAVKEVLELS